MESRLRTDNLSFKYGKNEILHNINFTAGQREIISLIGSNGCGKSTLIRCLSAHCKISCKTVFINGIPIENYRFQEISKKVSFLPQFHETLPGVSVYELISMGRTPYQKSGWIMDKNDKEKIEWAMEYMSLSEKKNCYIETLSGGEKQSAWIAMILAQDTPIILLDEPVTYMDIKNQWDLLETILDLKNNYGKTIVSVFHDINHAMEVSDVVYMMKNGVIYSEGPPGEVVTEESISEVYNICVHVCNFNKCCRQVIVPAGCNKYKKYEKR